MCEGSEEDKSVCSEHSENRAVQSAAGLDIGCSKKHSPAQFDGDESTSIDLILLYAVHVVVRISQSCCCVSEKSTYAMLAVSQPVNTNPANPFPCKQTTAH